MLLVQFYKNKKAEKAEEYMVHNKHSEKKRARVGGIWSACLHFYYFINTSGHYKISKVDSLFL